VQRLFSMFPNGWPGRGLLLLRLVSGIFLIDDGVAELLGGAQWPVVIRPLLETAAGMLLLVGLWTPMAGVLVVMLELWSILTRTVDLRNCAPWPRPEPCWRCLVQVFGQSIRSSSDESGLTFENTKLFHPPSKGLYPVAIV
jgi:hypothetical protein